MPKPATPLIWASGKSFGFQPSSAQQAQGFDYIASLRPSTGAPITDDHDWPLKNITEAVKWVMDQIPDAGLKSAAFRDVGIGALQLPDMSRFAYSKTSAQGGYVNLPGALIQSGDVGTDQNGAASITFPVPFPTDYVILATHIGGAPIFCYEFGALHTLSGTQFRTKGPDGSSTPDIGSSIRWVAVMVRS